MTTPIQTIREACIRSNPEIMELVRGCRFNWNHDFWTVNCHRCGDDRVFAFSCSGDAHDLVYENPDTVWEYKYRHFGKEEQEEFEILGRPITLADVLLAIENQYEYIVAGDGHFLKINWYNELGEMKYEGTGVYWDLRKPLESQSPETLEWLAKLL